MDILKLHNLTNELHSPQAKDESGANKVASSLDDVQKPDLGKLTVEPGEWNGKTEEFLREACADEISLKFLKDRVEKKQCELLNIIDNGKHVSSLVIVIDKNDKFTELVLLALAGSADGRIVMAVNAFADRFAKSINADSIRVHVTNEKLGGTAERFGYAVSETIYRKPVK